jgi:hypothetical protein
MATTTKKTAARPVRSKAEVKQEFAGIQKEVEAVRESADAKSAEFARQQEEGVRQAVEGVSVESVVQTIGNLGVEIARALAGVSERLTQEVNRLANVREAVELEREELQRLHKIDVAATALDQLVQDYAREKQKLDAEIAAQRQEWEQESEAAEGERKEQEDALKKQRQRENEDFEYKKTLERKKAQDKYDEEQRLLEKKNQEKQEAFEKSWQQREAALKAQEEELARLRKESEQFPARLKSETSAAAAQAARETSAQFEQKIVLLKKDAESDGRLAALQIKTLEATIAQLTAQLSDVHKQFAEAKQQVQDIAVKAIEGASGANALAHVNQIAIEQAKQRSSQS